MEELASIITAAVKAWGLERYIIFCDKRGDAKKARDCIAYIVNEYHPHLLYTLRTTMNKTPIEIREAAHYVPILVREDERAKKALVRMLRHLKLPYRREIKETPQKRVESCTKQLFGFDYNDEEILRYYRILDEAPAFWKRMQRVDPLILI